MSRAGSADVSGHWKAKHVCKILQGTTILSMRIRMCSLMFSIPVLCAWSKKLFNVKVLFW